VERLACAERTGKFVNLFLTDRYRAKKQSNKDSQKNGAYHVTLFLAGSIGDAKNDC
jgi:hypothetical protein